MLQNASVLSHYLEDFLANLDVRVCVCLCVCVFRTTRLNGKRMIKLSNIGMWGFSLVLFIGGGCCRFKKCKKTNFPLLLVNIFLRQFLKQDFRILQSSNHIISIHDAFLFLCTHTHLDAYVYTLGFFNYSFNYIIITPCTITQQVVLKQEKLHKNQYDRVPGW